MSSIQLTRGSLYRLVVLIAIIGAALWWWEYRQPTVEQPETPLVSFADRPSPAPLKILLTAPGAYVCERGECSSAPVVLPNSVTDGQWWYYYEEENNPTSLRQESELRGAREPVKVYLRRRNAEGKTETIMESTSLTTPRSLYMSPNGQHVAFWLDNISEPAEQLTELWVYDVADGGIRLLAEKVYQPDVRSEVVWNAQATYLWFIADTGPRTLPNDRLELVLVNSESPGTKGAFPDVSWDDVVEDISTAKIDLSLRADRLAYATSNFLGDPILMVYTPQGQQRTSMHGKVAYLQWLEDDSLLYALQDKEGFTFWRVRDSIHRFIARRPGQLTAARSDIEGEHIVFATQAQQAIHLASLHIQSGAVVEEGVVAKGDEPAFAPARGGAPAGKPAIAWVEQMAPLSPADQAARESALDDAELVAFVQKNFAAITGAPSQPLRLIITDQANVLFLDYRQIDGGERRLLVKVQDAVNTEWLVKARYEPVSREWKKVQGGGLADPKPLRLYEWEQSLRQWVLKENVE